MNRAKRAAARASAETSRANARRYQLQKKDRIEHNKEIVQYSIAKDNRKQLPTGQSTFIKTVAKKAPRLLEGDYITAVKMLEEMKHCRGIDTWKPKGKGRDTLFISLANHLLAEYPTPKFIWSAFWEHNRNTLARYVARIAAGESFSKMCKKGEFPLPLTKKQCHSFLKTTSDYTFMSALRRVQVQTHGGSPNLLKAWMARDLGRRLNDNAEEVFWDSVLGWFAKNPMLDLQQMGPLLDYIQRRHQQNNNFSMKGRSALALIRDMQEWHQELNTIREYKARNFDTSGFQPGFYDVKKKKGTEHWAIEEIRTANDLMAEGRAHHHCVYSYTRSIASGRVSIWSMTCNGNKMITIEVHNQAGQITQARGTLNRQTTAQEFNIIQKWANKNNLQVRLSVW